MTKNNITLLVTSCLITGITAGFILRGIDDRNEKPLPTIITDDMIKAKVRYEGKVLITQEKLDIIYNNGRLKGRAEQKAETAERCKNHIYVNRGNFKEGRMQE